jgi:Na+/H+-dicarboxylate symporter
LLWLLPIGWLALIAAVAAAQGLRNMAAVQHFMAAAPGRSGQWSHVRCR